MATIRLLVSNSMRAVMDELIPRFEREQGHQVEISYDPAKLMMERIRRGESAEARDGAQDAEDAGCVRPETG